MCCIPGPIKVAATEQYAVHPNGVVLGEEPGPGCPMLCCGTLLSLAFFPIAPLACIGLCCMVVRSINVNGIVFTVNKESNTVECTVCCKHWTSEESTTLPNIQHVDVQMVRKVEVAYKPSNNHNKHSHDVPRHDIYYEVMHISYLDTDGVLKLFTTKELGHPRKHMYTKMWTGLFTPPTFTPEAFPDVSYYAPMLDAVRQLIANNRGPGLQQPQQQQAMYRSPEPAQQYAPPAHNGYATVPMMQAQVPVQPGHNVYAAVPMVPVGSGQGIVVATEMSVNQKY